MTRFALLLCALLLIVPAVVAEEVGIAGLSFTIPKGWDSVPPATAMRAAQWTVPARGDAGPGEAVVFFFGPGQGGDAQANVARWSGTVTTAQGTPAVGQTSTRHAGGIAVTQLEVYGTYANSMGSPGLPALPKPGYGLVGVILEYPGGPVFFRLLGPEARGLKQLPAFTGMIDSAKAIPVPASAPR